MIAACLLMYAMATAHWGILLGLWRKASMLNEANFLESIQSILGNSSDYIAECALEDSIEIIAASPSNPLNPLGIVLPTCAPTSTVTVNIILSDAIVLFRACTIWNHKRAIKAVSVVLFVILLAASIVNLWSSCAIGGASGDCTFCGIFGLPAICSSLLVNLWATATIGFMAWTHKRTVKNYLTTGNTQTRAEKLLALFVDTGVLYSALWAFLVASLSTIPLVPLFFQTTSLIQLVGMYPTLLVVAVSIEKLLGSETIHTIHILTQDTRLPRPGHMHDMPLSGHAIMVNAAANSSTVSVI
ncbi:hypothetical protein BC629DRAFT_1610630 [Irpex lacteus]|nr:hypothetical protein BC629DRAFT_1610630 [Irpex lacteus]